MSRLEAFENNLMTPRDADVLAELYGGGATLDEFAESLPQDARVADVGAGLSTFGRDVALRRPDITWTNLDLNYDAERGHRQYGDVERAAEAAPPNLEFVAADVLDLPANFRGQYNKAYSYNLVPHLQRIDRRIGKGLGHQALTGMVGLLGNGGELMVGPTNSKMMTDERWNVTTLLADASEEEITEVQRLLSTSRVASMYYTAAGASGVSLFPGRQFGREEKLVISGDAGQTTHGLMSGRGLRLAGKLATGFVRR